MTSSLPTDPEIATIIAQTEASAGTQRTVGQRLQIATSMCRGLTHTAVEHAIASSMTSFGVDLFRLRAHLTGDQQQPAVTLDPSRARGRKAFDPTLGCTVITIEQGALHLQLTMDDAAGLIEILQRLVRG